MSTVTSCNWHMNPQSSYLLSTNQGIYYQLTGECHESPREKKDDYEKICQENSNQENCSQRQESLHEKCRKEAHKNLQARHIGDKHFARGALEDDRYRCLP